MSNMSSMIMKRLWLSAHLCAVLFAVATFSASARAQTVITGPLSDIVTRVDSKGNAVTVRPASQKPTWFSKSDCFADQEIVVGLTVTGVTNTVQIQAWAGLSDCASNENRNGQNPTCWAVTDPRALINGPTSVRVRVQDIVANMFSTNSKLSSGIGKQYVHNDNAVCSRQTPGSGETGISIFFYAISGGTTVDGTGYAYKTTVKLVGPPAVTGITLAPGNSALTVGWTPAQGISTILNYNIFWATDARPNPASAPVDGDGAPDASDASDDAAADPDEEVDLSDEDAGQPDDADASAGSTDADASADDGGVDASTAVEADAAAPSMCRSSLDGLVDTINLRSTVKSGQTNSSGGLTSSYRIKGLHNNKLYAVAVGAVDILGNVGQLSTIQCGEPVETIGFWDRYTHAGGLAGGGFCSVNRVVASPDTGGSWHAWWALVAGAAGVALVLARRRR